MVNWQYYPKSREIPPHLQQVIDVFNQRESEFGSCNHLLESNQVLLVVREDLEALGWEIEKGTKMADKIRVPVLFGLDGKLEKHFQADGYHRDMNTVMEIEAGRGVTNNQFLKDLFQACMMHDVRYLVIAVRKIYRKSKDFDKVLTFFDTLYASGRLSLPLDGILVVGY